MTDPRNSQLVTREANDSLPFKIPMLTPSTYTSWAIKMEAIMDAQGVWDSIEPPATGIVDQKLSKKARAFIFQSLPEDVLMQVAVHKSAKEVWDALKTSFVGETRVKQAKIQSLDVEFENLSMGDDESIDQFAGKMGEIVSKYRALGTTITNPKQVRKFLKACPEKFLPIAAAIEQFADLETMPFAELGGRLKAYEERIKPIGQKKSSNGQLLMSRTTYKTNGGEDSKGRGSDAWKRLQAAVPRTRYLAETETATETRGNVSTAIPDFRGRFSWCF